MLHYMLHKPFMSLCMYTNMFTFLQLFCSPVLECYVRALNICSFEDTVPYVDICMTYTRIPRPSRSMLSNHWLQKKGISRLYCDKFASCQYCLKNLLALSEMLAHPQSQSQELYVTCTLVTLVLASSF